MQGLRLELEYGNLVYRAWGLEGFGFKGCGLWLLGLARTRIGKGVEGFFLRVLSTA